MRISFSRAVLGGLLVGLIGLLTATVPAQAAWSPVTTLASETNPSGPSLEINDYVGIDQAILDDGTSIAGWTTLSGGTSTLHARIMNRGGTSLGPDITVIDVPAVFISDWAVSAAGSGFVFFWVERSNPGVTELTELKMRTMSVSGVLGAVKTLDSATVPVAEGFVEFGALSASSGGGFANVVWTLDDRRGPVASGCNQDTYVSTDGPCTFTQKGRFARVSEDGTMTVAPSDVLSRQYTSSNTTCERPSMGMDVATYPSSGAATVVIQDYCRPAGGDSTMTNLFSRVSASGQISPPEFLSLGFVYGTVISSDGTTVVSGYDRLYRIPPKGSVQGPILNATEFGRQWSGGVGSAIALPQNRQIVVASAQKISGNDLTHAIWTRVVEADGSLGKARQVFTRTVSSPDGDPGTPRLYYFIEAIPSGGLGKETGTVLVEIEQFNRLSSTSQNSSDEVVAFALNSKGAKVAGSEATLATTSVTFSPATNYGGTSAISSLVVGRDGTASAAILTTKRNYLQNPPFPGTAEAALVASKLVRNPKTCGVTPSLCKAKLKVAALKLARSGGSKAKLTITLKNAGNKDASKVKAKLSATGGAKVPKTVTFPQVLEGKTAKKTVTVTLGSGSGSIKVKAGKSSKTARF